MPIDETIGAGLNLILEIINILNPTELERVKKEIRKKEKEIAERDKKIAEAIATGDIDALNAILFSE